MDEDIFTTEEAVARLNRHLQIPESRILDMLKNGEAKPKRFSCRGRLFSIDELNRLELLLGQKASPPSSKP